MNISSWGILSNIRARWAEEPQPDIEDDYEVIEPPERPAAPLHVPAFKAFRNKHKLKLTKAQKKSKIRLSKMWP